MMEIVGCGEKLTQVAGGENKLLKQLVTKFFRLRRPKGITFNWKNVRTQHFDPTRFKN
jgi:guanylate cyclase